MTNPAVYRVSVPDGRSGLWSVVRDADHTCLLRGDTIVMTDTADEWQAAAAFVARAHGRVLINGLGLGMVLGAVLATSEVQHVDVVEQSADVLRLVGPTYASDPRVTLHHADARTYRFPDGDRWSAVWHDIWDAPSLDHLPEMARLHRRYGHRCGWQGCWSRDQLHPERSA